MTGVHETGCSARRAVCVAPAYDYDSCELVGKHESSDGGRVTGVSFSRVFDGVRVNYKMRI